MRSASINIQSTRDISGLVIKDIASLDEHLSTLCDGIHSELGMRNLEATFSNALRFDLQDCGVVVDTEVSINLTYRGRVIGTRRADMVLSFHRSAPPEAVIEIKAVNTLASDHLRQLEFYMAHFGIPVGYLINFSREYGFPDVDDKNIFFQQIRLSGSGQFPLFDGVLRKSRCEPVEIIKVLLKTSVESTAESSSKSGTGADKTEFEGRRLFSEGAASMDSGNQVGITKNGVPCKLCQAEGTWCGYHRPVSDLPPGSSISVAVAAEAFEEMAIGSRSKSSPPDSQHTNKIFGVTKQGKPCKICIMENRFCDWHISQEKKK